MLEHNGCTDPFTHLQTQAALAGTIELAKMNIESMKPVIKILIFNVKSYIDNHPHLTSYISSSMQASMLVPLFNTTISGM